MDDDIRNRFRGARQSRPVPGSYGRLPARPQPMPAKQPLQQPMPRPSQPVTPPKKSEIQPVATMPKAHNKTHRRGRKRLLRTIIILVVLMLVGGVGFMGYKKYFKKAAPATDNIMLSSETSEEPKTEPKGTIRFVATGDNLAFESINNAAKKPDGSYDYLPLMNSVKPFFDKSDIRFCNESTPGGGEQLGISAFPKFNAPTAWSTGFANLGCNVMNLGTDHANDKGQEAIDAMLATWDQQKEVLAVAGANRSAEEQAKIKYFTVKGVKFALLSYVTRSNNPPTNTFGINMFTDALAKSQVAEARKNADLIIVSMNWGTENSSDINADQDRVAQVLADNNVDIVLGNGPHVLQPAKVLSGTDGHQTLVWFSLGNFLNSQVPVENLVGGMAVMDIDIGTHQIIEPRLLPFYMHYEWTADQKKRQSQADLLARSNFALYPLDMAAEVLAKSQNNTTVEAQTERVKSIITKFVPIKVIKSTEF